MTKITKRDKSSTKYPLEHIDIELTRECNLACKHCSAGVDTQGKELTTDKIETILQEAKSLGLNKVGFTGGEPLLRKRKLRNLADFCYNELKTPIHIHSNGLLITEDVAEWLKRMDVEITIPLYGATSKTHDFITNTKRSLKSAWKGINTLLHANMDPYIFIVPMKPNVHEIPSLIRLIHQKGIRKIRILTLSPTGRAKPIFNQLNLDSKETLTLNAEFSAIQNKLNLNLEGGFCTRLQFPSLHTLRGHEQCYAAENRIHIDAFGNVFPCTASSGNEILSVGNLQSYSYDVQDIWKLSPFLQFLRKFHLNPPAKCEICQRFSECMSGCRVRVFYEHNDITIADPECGGPFIKSVNEG